MSLYLKGSNLCALSSNTYHAEIQQCPLNSRLLRLHLLFKLSYYIMELTTGGLLSPPAPCLAHNQVTYTCNLIFSISMR